MVTSMILTQYDEQKHIENEKRWSHEEGMEVGLELSNKLNQFLMNDGRTDEMKRVWKDTAFQKILLQEYGLI